MIEILDPRFAPVVQASQLVQLCTGAAWSEGPVWLHEDDSVLWSDIPNNRMLRWSEAQGMTVWRDKVEFTNGHTRDLNGDLLHWLPPAARHPAHPPARRQPACRYTGPSGSAAI